MVAGDSWHMPVIQHLGSEGKKDYMFKVTLGYKKRKAILGF